MLKHISAAFFTLSLATSAQAKESYHWVQYVPGGVEARAISDGAECPAAAIDGGAVKMTVRAEPGDNYPIRVCAMPIPSTAKAATIEGQPLALPVAKPKRILVIGDTGCRLKGKQVQACNDAQLWPFQAGASVAAYMKPDLVIDVGDYHYRETACPDGNAGCAGSPFGDTWDVWRADFFIPAGNLLSTVPWALVRGNHEECERGGKGWARTMDPYAFDAAQGASGCLGPQKPFTLDIGGVTVVMMDVSTAKEDKVDEKQAAAYKEQFQALSKLAPNGPAWLAFHRPIWSTDGSVKAGETGGDNQTLAAAADGNIPANVQLTLSGHHHKFEVDAYEQDLPLAIISGHGGDDISPDVPKNPVGLTVNGKKINAGFAKPLTYGFAMLERGSDDKWTVIDYDVKGNALGRCAIDGRKVACQ